MERLRILIWHVHGSYLNTIVHAPHEFFLPTKPGKPEGYGGKGPTFIWPPNVHEVPAEEVKSLDLDLVVFQSPKNYFEDQHEILSDAQRHLPRIYLEHNTPKGHPDELVHPVTNPEVLIVHVTHFNNIMWDSGPCQTKVIQHAVVPRPHINCTGELKKGVVVVNDIKRRQRVVGCDVWEWMRERVPLDLFGLHSVEAGGLGDLAQEQLLRAEAHYRFFFNPIRYTSMPLAVVEAMSIGLPIVALSTTELPEVIQNGVSGFVSNDLEYLADRMKYLIEEPEVARRMGQKAKAAAEKRFGLARFVADWEEAFKDAMY